MVWPVLLLLFVAVSFAQDEPELTIEPMGESISKDLDSNGYFTCSAPARFQSLVTDFQWIDPRGQVVPADDGRIYTVELQPGPGRELYIDKISEDDTGNYTCKAVYANRDIEKSFNLDVYMSIRWEDAPEEQNPTNGTNAKIKCVVKSNPVALLDWKKDGEIITSGGRYVIEQDGLSIQGISSQDDGTYICRAKVMTFGIIEERAIIVEVHSAPVILQPESGTQVEVVEHESGSIRCEASGKPTPKRTWYTPDNAPAETVSGLNVDPRDGTLNFSPASRDMGGQYRCKAENSAGQDEVTVEVTVVVKPEIVKYENVTEGEGGVAELRCEVAGSPLPSIEFGKQGSDVRFVEGQYAEDARISVLRQTEEHAIGILTITNLSRSDDGLYECVAINKGGQEVRNGHVTVQFAPRFEGTPVRQMYTWNGNSRNITCVAEAIPNATVTWSFKGVELKPDADFNIVQYGKGPVSALEITPSDSSYYGMYTCRASNLLGDNELDIELFEANVPSIPANVEDKVMTATTIEFAISSPGNDGGLPVTAYAVQYKTAGQSWDEPLDQLWPVGSSYIVSDLQPEQQYVFRLAAKNDVGLSEWSAELQRTLPRIAAPEPPVLLFGNSSAVPEGYVVPAKYGDLYEVQWRAGPDNGEQIYEMQLTYYQVENSSDTWQEVSDKHTAEIDYPGRNTYKLSGLTPSSFYRVELRARNKIGYGTAAQVIFRTGTDETEVAGSTEIMESVPSSVLIAVAIVVLLLLLLIVDVICCAVCSRGLTYVLCRRGADRRANKQPNPQTISEKEPLRGNGNENGHHVNGDHVNGDHTENLDVKIDPARLNNTKDSQV